jgi:catechol 2,3-dioxygenase-like lactoylglutathione lyase family enzyme
MLDAIVAVTLSAPDLGATARAYEAQLGYRRVEEASVSRSLAKGWGAPATKGRDYVLMQPASGEPVYLRIVEADEPAPGYAPLKTFGWNANEILVEDPVALAPLLKEPFRIIGEPRPLDFNPNIIAMQVTGPAGEVAYFTRIPPQGSVFDLGSARSFVDRTFIVVTGGPDVDASRAFYRDVLQMPTTDPAPTKIQVLQDAYGLPRDAQTRIGIVRFPSSFLIELDQYPAAAVPRPTRRGHLPPGIAMVSFAVKSFEGSKLPWKVTPRVRTERPYDGRRAGILVGPAGEWIELIETGAGCGQQVACGGQAAR